MENKEKKNGFLGFIENVWFYHKWQILVGALIIMFLGIATVQCMGKVSPEITVLFVGDMDIGADREQIVEEFGYTATDLNGNGEVDLSFAFFSLNDPDVASKFNTEIMVGDHHVYIVNDKYFEKLLIGNALAPLSDVLGHTPENTEGEGYGIRLKYLDVSETEGFDSIDRNSILCFRCNGDKRADYEGGTDLYKNNFKFIKALLNYKGDVQRESVSLLQIGKQSLYAETVYDLEHSVFNIGKKFDAEHTALLNYEELKLITNSKGVLEFGESEQATVSEMSKGNKIMVVSGEVYEYLKDKNALISFEELGIKLGADGEEYGIKLSEIADDKVTDVTETPGFKHLDGEMYLCGTADIDGYTADMLTYLRKWTEG